MAMLPDIQSLWIGDKLSTLEKMTISSFISNGHSFHLYAYNELDGLPDGVILKDANEIINGNIVFKNPHHNTYTFFADMFRCKLLLEKGGFWVDMDIFCLKPFDFKEEYIFASELRKYTNLFFLKWSDKVNNCVIKAPAGSEMMEYCYHVAKSYDIKKINWLEIGPRLLANAISKFKLSEFVMPYYTFSPVNFWQWRKLFQEQPVEVNAPGISEMFPKSYAIHFWNEMLRRNGIDKDAGYSPNSIYGMLQAKYL